MGCISTNSLSWHKPALQQLLSEGTPPFPFLCLIPGPVQLLSPCWHQHTHDCEVNQARKLCQLKTKPFFLFPRLVSTWMSSLMWFIAGPQEHLCWHKVGSSRGVRRNVGCGCGEGRAISFSSRAGLCWLRDLVYLWC